MREISDVPESRGRFVDFVEFHKPPEGEEHLITNFPTYHGISL
jgi:hypothetical protein